jgi:hypothetical protein
MRSPSRGWLGPARFCTPPYRGLPGRLFLEHRLHRSVVLLGGALRASFSVDDGNEQCGEAFDLCF